MTALSQQEPRAAGPSRLDRLRWLQAAMSVVIALCLVVPESEVRAKAFKLNLIVKNIRRATA